MTIIVGIATRPDGIILASDSRMTRSLDDGYRILSDSSQKVFEDGGYGVAMAGIAFIADHTIAGLMDQFLAQATTDDRKTVDTFADALGAFFHRRFEAWFESAGETYDVEKSGFQLLFFVAGYDDKGIGHIRQVLIPGPESGDESPDTTMPETIRGGQTDVIDRLLLGVDWDKAAIPKDAISDEANERLRWSHTTSWSRSPCKTESTMHHFSSARRSTCSDFSDGTIGDPGLVPGCGGPLQVLVVEQSRTRWAARLELRVS